MRLSIKILIGMLALSSIPLLFFEWRQKDLKDFCRSLKVGDPLVHIRVDAEEDGWKPSFQSGTELRIRSAVLPATVHCRVHFDKNRILSFRTFQNPEFF